MSNPPLLQPEADLPSAEKLRRVGKQREAKNSKISLLLKWRLMQLNKYEGVFIFKPDLEEKALEEEYSKVEDIIKKHEGKIEKSEKWGKKKLAYEIKKFRDGFFLYLSFETMPQTIKPLSELFKLNNNILRAQIMRKEK
jgi:small subunit ribosomal protein S6